MSKSESTPKKKRMGLGIFGAAILLIAASVLYTFFFDIHGDELLARGDQYADEGNIVRAVIDYEKYILEDKTNPVGYLRLIELYKDDSYRTQRADVYRRFVKYSGVDDENIYVDAIKTLVSCRDYESARLANQRGMERLGETKNASSPDKMEQALLC